MTETRPVQTPPPPARAAETPPPANAVIESVPRDLDDVTRLLKIRGEVFQSRADGMVRILTDKGEITVRLDPRQPVPAKGDVVEIEIRPGQPPTTARVSPAPSQTNIETPPQRAAETPVDVTVRPSPETQTTEPPQRPIADIPVRLEPVPYETIKPYIQDPIETIVTATTQPTQQKIQLIAQNIIDDAAAKLIQTFPAPSQQTAILINNDEQKFSTPALNTNKTVTIEKIIENSVQSSSPSFLSGLTPQLSLSPINGGEGSRERGTTPDNPFLALTQIQIDESDVLQSPARALLKSVKQFFTAHIAAVQEQTVHLFAAPGKTVPLQTHPEQPILNNQKAGTITASIVAHTPQNLPVIAIFQNPAAPSFETASFFILHAPALPAATLIPGTEISFIPQNNDLVSMTTQTPAQAGFVSTPIATPLTPFAPQPWPVMNDILDALNDVSLPSAQVFSNIMPAPARPANIPPAALFFIAALRGGDLASWIGERVTDALKRAGREGLISRLSGEGAALNRAETINSDWRGVSIPLYMDNEIHKLALYYKHERDSNPDAPEGGKMVRFIFDLALDAMGKVQLDGLFRANKLDLIVRSEAPFSTAMQMQMRGAYIAALEPTEVRGELSFQNKPEQWVTIKAERAKFGTEA